MSKIKINLTLKSQVVCVFMLRNRNNSYSCASDIRKETQFFTSHFASNMGPPTCLLGFILVVNRSLEICKENFYRRLSQPDVTGNQNVASEVLVMSLTLDRCVNMQDVILCQAG